MDTICNSIKMLRNRHNKEYAMLYQKTTKHYRQNERKPKEMSEILYSCIGRHKT